MSTPSIHNPCALTMTQIRAQEILVGGVPAAVLGADRCHESSETTLVVLVHGRESSKEATTVFAECLLQTCPDIMCVVFDLPNHGARTISNDTNRSWRSGNELHMVQMVSLVDQGAAEATTLLRFTPCFYPKLKITRRVIIGASLGGYIAWRVAADSPELLTAVVPVISSPNLPAMFASRWQQYYDANTLKASEIQSYAFPKSAMADLVEKAAKIEDIKTKPLAVLAICGADDDLVPPEHTAEWATGAGLNKKVEFFPGVKHTVTRGMMDLTAEFILGIETAT